MVRGGVEATETGCRESVLLIITWLSTAERMVHERSEGVSHSMARQVHQSEMMTWDRTGTEREVSLGWLAIRSILSPIASMARVVSRLGNIVGYGKMLCLACFIFFPNAGEILSRMSWRFRIPILYITGPDDHSTSRRLLVVTLISLSWEALYSLDAQTKIR